MGKLKHFDLDSDGNLVKATKLFINNTTYEIEQQKTPDNFEVDTLIAKSISLLNKKGYKTVSSNSGHVYKYFLNQWPYDEENLQTDEEGNKFIYIGYLCDSEGNGLAVKYQLVQEDSDDYKEFVEKNPEAKLGFQKVESLTFFKGVFRVTFPYTKVNIEFDEPYTFSILPAEWHNDKNGIMHLINFSFQTLNYRELEQRIIEENEKLLQWVEELPDLNN